VCLPQTYIEILTEHHNCIKKWSQQIESDVQLLASRVRDDMRVVVRAVVGDVEDKLRKVLWTFTDHLAQDTLVNQDDSNEDIDTET